MIRLSDSRVGAPRLNLDELVASRLLINANSGGGKSYALRRLLEQTHGKIQQIVLDVEGDFYTLREKYDYLLVGEEGDVPVSVTSAALLARRLLELGLSAIIDIYGLAHRERVEFVAHFCDALVNAPKSLWHPALIVVDEAHKFAPEEGKELLSRRPVVELMAQGRKRGFAGCLATQRLSKLSKDAAAEANNYMVGRTALDVDVKRASDILGFSKENAAKLRQLDPGDFFVFGPAFGKTVEQLHVGAVETSHPRPGKVAPRVRPPSSVVKAALGELRDLPKKALEEARTLEQAKVEIAALKRELEMAKRRVVSTTKVVEVPVLGKRAEKALARAEKDVRALTEAVVSIQQGAANVAKEFELLRREVASADRATPPVVVPTLAETLRRELTPARVREVAPGRVAIEGLGALPVVSSDAKQRIIEALWLFGVWGSLTRQQLAVLSRFRNSRSSGFRNPLYSLHAAGEVEFEGDRVALTAAGRAKSKQGFQVASGEGNLTVWSNALALLRPPQAKAAQILRSVVERGESGCSREELARLHGHENERSSGFRNPLYMLSALELVCFKGAAVLPAALGKWAPR